MKKEFNQLAALALETANAAPVQKLAGDFGWGKPTAPKMGGGETV